MEWYHALIIASIMLHIAHFFVWVDNMSEGMGYGCYPCLIPKHIYKGLKVNWFGAILLYILYFICVPVFAILSFIYWLCTVGRKY